MSSTTDKIKGLANEAVGNIKQGVGSVTGNEKLQAEGKAQELKGEAQKTVTAPKPSAMAALTSTGFQRSAAAGRAAGASGFAGRVTRPV